MKVDVALILQIKSSMMMGPLEEVEEPPNINGNQGHLMDHGRMWEALQHQRTILLPLSARLRNIEEGQEEVLVMILFIPKR